MAGVVGRLAVRVLRRWFLPPDGAEAGEADPKQGKRQMSVSIKMPCCYQGHQECLGQ